jgi:signal transduction histidine kinase
MSRAVLNEMYYLGSEALHNAFRHAKASRITLTLDLGRDLVLLSVADNGIGIPRQVLQSGAGDGHWGLISMHERAGLVGGDLILRSGTRGTEVCLSIPMAA